MKLLKTSYLESRWFEVLGFAYSPQPTGYLKCMDTNTKKCLKAHMKAKEYCEAKYTFMPNSTDEELRLTAKKYGDCITNKNIPNLGADFTKFENCAVYLEPIFNAKYNDALKKYKELDSKFFEEDDPLHNNSK